MASMNLVLVIGTLGRDPDFGQTQSGLPSLRMSVACDKNSKDSNGNWAKTTTWFGCFAFGYTAERAQTLNLHKGSNVAVQGQIESYTKRDGTPGWKVNVDRITSLDSRPRQQNGYPQQQMQAAPNYGYNQFPPRGGYPSSQPQQYQPAPQQAPLQAQAPSEEAPKLDTSNVNTDGVPF